MKNTDAWRDNPRDDDPSRLAGIAESMERFGPLEGIVVNVRDGRVLVGGHQRVGHMPDDIEPVISERFAEPTETGTVAVGHVDYAGERWAYREVDWDEETHAAAGLAANQHGSTGWRRDKLMPLLDRSLALFERSTLGFTVRDAAAARQFVHVAPNVPVESGGVDDGEVDDAQAVAEAPDVELPAGFIDAVLDNATGPWLCKNCRPRMIDWAKLLKKKARSDG